MKLWVGVTDEDWFNYLSARRPDEVNFWQPSGEKPPKRFEAGEPFLFKLHAPKNYVVGGGFFVQYSALPCSIAWEAFGKKNGVRDQKDLLERIRRYRDQTEPDPLIGCNVLAEPFFFPERAWIPIPSDWKPNIVQGKTYDTSTEVGASLWAAVQANLAALGIWRENDVKDEERTERPEYLVKGRLGQGAFRILVTDAYHRRCAVTGERTLPVLEAAHIKPYASDGPNLTQNGLLLRSDLHKLFDIGYLTVTPDFRVEISAKIKEEYENGREYYAHHGQLLTVLPELASDKPSRQFLEWHNQNRFVA